MTAIITTSSPVIIDRKQSATWEDYLHRVESPQSELERVFFNCGSLWIEDLGNEGINHARSSKLITMILASWFVQQGKSKFDLLGGCGIEKSPYQAAVYLLSEVSRSFGLKFPPPWTSEHLIAGSN